MVRFAPPLARLVTLALNARLQQNVVTPPTLGLPTVASGSAPAIGDPIAAHGTPTGYRDSRRGAEKGGMPPKEFPYGVRTSEDPPVSGAKALLMLKEGNERFVSGNLQSARAFDGGLASLLAAFGERPVASIFGCTDARVPIELLFDAGPGDLLTFRTSGFTLSNGGDGLVMGLEDSINSLGVKLILVLGHTDCLALIRASQRLLHEQTELEKGTVKADSNLAMLWESLQPVVEQAQRDLKGSLVAEEIAAEAVKVNVFAQMERILSQSSTIREKVGSGEVELQGAVYDLGTGKVEFLGQLPRQKPSEKQ